MSPPTIDDAYLIRHQGRVDLDYVKRTAQRMADELHDAGVWRRLQQLLRPKSS